MTLDKERLRVLAEAVEGWSSSDSAWPCIDPEDDGVAFVGHVDSESGDRDAIVRIDTGLYYQEDAAMPLAEFYAAANPAAVLALLSENAALAAEVELLRKDAGHAEPMTRFCPGCGSVGEVPKKYRDCCPDGGDSRVIPTNLANKCHDLFQGALQAAMADKGGAPCEETR